LESYRRRIDRLIGLVVIIVLSVVGGIGGFVATFQAISESPGIPFVYTLISLALPLFLSGAAIWAFTGQNEGRIALVILVVLNWAWPMLLVVGALIEANGESDGNIITALVGLTIRALFVFAVAWYLLSKRVSEYYHQNDGKQSV